MSETRSKGPSAGRGGVVFNHEVPLTRTKSVLNGLASGTKYWRCVASIGAACLSQWTNAVVVVA